ncbi:hypothetical protein KRX57_10500 [Weeksellaceae bacterium TAE3-ERU29]|nr:hypothetical protein [Weeksellaceae bacterium TAE3-ERU29]
MILLFNILLVGALNKWRLGGKKARFKPKFNVKYLLKGFRYAGLFMIVSAVMGGLYGLISGAIIQPAMFAVVVTGAFVMINFVISVLVWIFTLVFYSLGEQSLG